MDQNSGYHKEYKNSVSLTLYKIFIVKKNVLKNSMNLEINQFKTNIIKNILVYFDD